MGQLYFVRHGQTVWNVENKICGSTDIDLTELGHQQAFETGKKILEQNIFEDIVPEISKESFENSPACLSIIDTFIDTKIYYTYEEYLEHLNLLKEYENNHKNYIFKTDVNLTFKTIKQAPTITIKVKSTEELNITKNEAIKEIEQIAIVEID